MQGGSGGGGGGGERKVPTPTCADVFSSGLYMTSGGGAACAAAAAAAAAAATGVCCACCSDTCGNAVHAAGELQFTGAGLWGYAVLVAVSRVGVLRMQQGSCNFREQVVGGGVVHVVGVYALLLHCCRASACARTVGVL